MSLTAEVDLTLPAAQRLPEHGVHNKLNPLELSQDEMKFILEHLEDRPAQALKGYDKAIPHNPEEEHGIHRSVNPWCEQHPGVHPKVVEKVLGRIRDIEDSSPENLGYYKRDAGMARLIGRKPDEELHGLEAIATAIQDGQLYLARLDEVRKQEPDAAIHPSMHTIDARRNLHWQAPGSDRGMVRRFTCELFHDTRRKIAPDWIAAAATDQVQGVEEPEKASGIGGEYRLIEGDNYFECPVDGCNYRRQFMPDNEGDRNAALNAMRTHMSNIKTDIDDHREAKVVIFGS